MILILSTPTDLDTEKVIEWLNHFEEPFFRLNDEDLMMGITEFFFSPHDSNKTYFSYKGEKVFLKDIRTVWFRKFGFLSTYEKELDRNSDFYKYIYSEFSSVRKLILELLADKKWLYKKGVLPSKPLVLEKAISVGLRTPNTAITSSKERLKNFNEKLITKPIGEGKQVLANSLNFPFMTLAINSVNHLPHKFSPSYVQEQIAKSYEIRVFYLEGKLFSMAIFSQNDKKTEIDFRVFDPEQPIRFVPYNLPKDVELKIIKFMKSINLNTGSLDFIKNTEGEYIFLEVNPAGQFGMTAYPCNYPLHKEVASTLIKL
tara:strand:- start:213 stop:1157 length:945 start_codon:yes stop_codon:yes gene_type:complete